MKILGLLLLLPLAYCAIYLAIFLWPVTLAFLGIWLIANA